MRPFDATFLDLDLPFRHPSVIPDRLGLYVRDWRGRERGVWIDLWLPVQDARDILHPGVWYVPPEWNDAVTEGQRLPWRPLTLDEGWAIRKAWPQVFKAAENACRGVVA